MPDTKKLIDSTSPEVVTRTPEWERYKLALAGGEAFAETAILQHPREGDDDYKKRKKQVYTIDFCRNIIMSRQKYLFKVPVVPIMPPAAKAVLEPFLNNIDLRGNSFNSFADGVSRDSMLFGSDIILVDATQQTVPFRSRAEQIAAGSRPYLVSYSPLDVQNFAQDAFGELLWILFKNGIGPAMLNESDYAGAIVEGAENTGFTLWTRDSWSKLDKDGVVYDIGDHGLGFVPVVNVPFTRLKNLYFGLSLLRDIEPLNRRNIGQWALLQEILENQTFGQLCVPDEMGGKDEHGQPKVVGTKSVLYYTGGQAPSFIQPDASNAATVLETIRATELAIEREAEMQGSIAMATPIIASGVAMAYKFRPTNAALGRQASILGPQLARVLWIMAKMSGVDADLSKFSVPFPADFGVTTSTELIADYATLTAGIHQPATPIIISMEQQIFTALNRDMPKDKLDKELAKIEDEISTTGDMVNMPPPIKGPANGLETTLEGGDDENR